MLHIILKRRCKVVRENIRTTLRIDNNLKTRIELLAIKNNISLNRMFIYIIELGYQTYLERFDKYYFNEDLKIKSEEERNE